MSDLVANLENPLPASLLARRATPVFVVGTCFHRRERIAALDLLVDGVRGPVDAFRMPRPDVALPERRSGFWGTALVPARAPGAARIELAARLAGGGEIVAPLGSIAIVAAPEPSPSTDLIAVCLATFDPDPELLAMQLESLRAQTDERWHCMISDDGSSPERFAALQEQVGQDPRFTLARGERLGFYRNFERALALAPPEAGLIAFCDQDDRWMPEKLATLRAALGDAGMVFSDQRLVDRSGHVLRDTLWVGRRNNHTDLAALLVANSITGAATLMRREVADLALPFPEPPGVQFHDHWLGLVALTRGTIAYVDRPLYDYVQHRGAVFGEVSGGERAGRRGGLLRRGRGAYFLGYVPRVVQARTLLARLGPTAAPVKRRALEHYVAAERSPRAFAWLAARAVTRRRQTLGSEVELLGGIVWRWVVPLLGRRGDARFPDLAAFEQRRLRRWRARV